MPSWTVLSTIPTVGQGEAVSRYSVGIADRSGLSLRLSPSDTNIIHYYGVKVNSQNDENTNYFWVDFVQNDEPPGRRDVSKGDLICRPLLNLAP